MSFNRHSYPVAAKAHKCVHCSEPIERGEKHYHYSGKWQGDFQDWRAHSDCESALRQCQDDDGTLCLNTPHPRGKSCAAIDAAIRASRRRGK